MGLLETLADALTRKASSKAEYGTPTPELTQQMRSGGLTGGLLRAANPMVWDENSAFAQWTRKPAGSQMGAAALDEILNGPVMGTFGGIGKKGVPGYVEDAATREANFKKWFGDSKVVDAEGKPLTVYRGDSIGKDVFNGNVFFSDRKSIGERYADGRQLNTAHLKMKNPLVVDAGGNSWLEVPAPLPIQKEWGNPEKTVQIDSLAEWARKKGYDGLIVKDVLDQWGDGNQYVTFKPTQIKSTSNRGTYDPTDPNILKSLIPAAATAYGIEEVLPYD